jgi:uncharacterized BrkB/YihY/UPF0761 family membrane protein
MDDEGHPEEPAEEGRLIIPPAVGKVVTKTSRFSREAIATMISLATAAFGLVAALAWNTAITTAFNDWLKNNDKAKISALFIYAVIVTLIGVTVIVLLGRLATRINAEPIEFKYPGTPKN